MYANRLKNQNELYENDDGEKMLKKGRKWLAIKRVKCHWTNQKEIQGVNNQ